MVFPTFYASKTDRQTYGQPWKLMDTGKRVTWAEVCERFEKLVRNDPPTDEKETI